MGHPEDGGHVEVGDEEVGVRAAQHDRPHGIVAGQSLDGVSRGQEQPDREEIDRWEIEGDRGDACVDLDRESGWVVHAERDYR